MPYYHVVEPVTLYRLKLTYASDARLAALKAYQQPAGQNVVADELPASIRPRDLVTMQPGRFYVHDLSSGELLGEYVEPMGP